MWYSHQQLVSCKKTLTININIDYKSLSPTYKWKRKLQSYKYSMNDPGKMSFLLSYNLFSAFIIHKLMTNFFVLRI